MNKMNVLKVSNCFACPFLLEMKVRLNTQATCSVFGSSTRIKIYSTTQIKVCQFEYNKLDIDERDDDDNLTDIDIDPLDGQYKVLESCPLKSSDILVQLCNDGDETGVVDLNVDFNSIKFLNTVY